MRRCIIDTNVMITANKAVSCQEDEIVSEYPTLVLNCIELLQRVQRKGIYVVLDEDCEIFDEYKDYLSFSGQPGVGDVFFKWLFDNCWGFPSSERIKLHKTENGYKEFPQGMEQANIDLDDMKFFAVSNAHPSKPDIFEATDSKWWNWRDAALQCGIRIQFLDEKYMRDKNPCSGS